MHTIIDSSVCIHTYVYIQTYTYRCIHTDVYIRTCTYRRVAQELRGVQQIPKRAIGRPRPKSLKIIDWNNCFKAVFDRGCKWHFSCLALGGAFERFTRQMYTYRCIHTDVYIQVYTYRRIYTYKRVHTNVSPRRSEVCNMFQKEPWVAPGGKVIKS